MWGSGTPQQQLRSSNLTHSPTTSRRAGFPLHPTTAAASPTTLGKQSGNFASGAPGSRAPLQPWAQVRSRQKFYGNQIDNDTLTTLISAPLPTSATLSWTRYDKGKGRARDNDDQLGSISSRTAVPDHARPSAAGILRPSPISSHEGDSAWEHALSALKRLAACERRSRVRSRRLRRRAEDVPASLVGTSSQHLLQPEQLLGGTLFTVEDRTTTLLTPSLDRAARKPEQIQGQGPDASTACGDGATASLWIFEVRSHKGESLASLPDQCLSSEMDVDVQPVENPALPSISSTAAVSSGASSGHLSLPDALTNWPVGCTDSEAADMDESRRQVLDTLAGWTPTDTGTYRLADVYPEMSGDGAAPPSEMMPLLRQASALLPRSSSYARAHSAFLSALEDALADSFVFQRESELDDFVPDPAQPTDSAASGIEASQRHDRADAPAPVEGGLSSAATEVGGAAGLDPAGVHPPTTPMRLLKPLIRPEEILESEKVGSSSKAAVHRSVASRPLGAAFQSRSDIGPDLSTSRTAAQIIRAAGGGRRRAVRSAHGIAMLPLDAAPPGTLHGAEATPLPSFASLAIPPPGSPSDFDHSGGALHLRFSAYTTRSSLVVRACPFRLPLCFLGQGLKLEGGSQVELVLLPSGKPASLESVVTLSLFEENESVVADGEADSGQGAGNVSSDLREAIEGLYGRLRPFGVARKMVMQQHWAICRYVRAFAEDGVARDATLLWPATLCLVDETHRPSSSQAMDKLQPEGRSRPSKPFDPSLPLQEVSELTLEMLHGLDSARTPEDLPTATAEEGFAVQLQQARVPLSPPLIDDDDDDDGDHFQDDGGDDNVSMRPHSAANDGQTTRNGTVQELPSPTNQLGEEDSIGVATVTEFLQTSARASQSATLRNRAEAESASSASRNTGSMTVDGVLRAQNVASADQSEALPFQWSMFGPSLSGSTSHVGASRPRSQEEPSMLEPPAPVHRRGEGDMFGGFDLVTEDDFSFFDDRAFDLGDGFGEEDAIFSNLVDPLQGLGQVGGSARRDSQQHASSFLDPAVLRSLDDANLQAFLAPLPLQQHQEQHQHQPLQQEQMPSIASAASASVEALASLTSAPVSQGPIRETNMAVVPSAGMFLSTNPLAAQEGPTSGERRLHPSAMNGRRNSSDDLGPVSMAAPGPTRAQVQETLALHDTPRDGCSMGSLTDVPSLPGFTPSSLTSSSPAFGNGFAKTPRTPCSPNEEGGQHATVLAEHAPELNDLYRERGFLVRGSASAYPELHDVSATGTGLEQGVGRPGDTAGDPAFQGKPSSLVPSAFLPVGQPRHQGQFGVHLRNQPLDLHRKYGQLGKFASSHGVSEEWLDAKVGRRTSLSKMQTTGTRPTILLPPSNDPGAASSLHYSAPSSFRIQSKDHRTMEEVRRLRISRFKVPFVSGSRLRLAVDSPYKNAERPSNQPNTRKYRIAEDSDSESSSEDDRDSEDDSEDQAATSLQLAMRLDLVQNALMELSLYKSIPSSPLPSATKARRGAADRFANRTAWRPLSAEMLTTLATWIVEIPTFRDMCHPRPATRSKLRAGSRRIAPLAASDVLDLLPSVAFMVGSYNDGHSDAPASKNALDGPRLRDHLCATRVSGKCVAPDATESSQATESKDAASAEAGSRFDHLVRILEPPQIAAGLQGSVIQVAPTSLAFWDKLNLSAVGGPKHCVVKVLQLPTTPERQKQSRGWLEQVSRAFQTFGLGSLTPAPEAILTVGEDLDEGLSTYLDSLPPEIWLDTIGSIANRIQRHLKQGRHLVLYAVQSASSRTCRQSGYRGLLRLENELRVLLHGLVGNASGRFVVRPISPETMAESGVVGFGSHSDELRRLVFSIYDQLQNVVTRHVPKLLHPEKEVQHSDMVQYPAFSIASASTIGRSTAARYPLEWPPSPAGFWDKGMLLHIAYDTCLGTASTKAAGAGLHLEGSYSPGVSDAALTVISSIDERAQSHVVQAWDTQSVRAQVKAVWRFALRRARRANVAWRIVVCKASPMSPDEIRAWSDLAADVGKADSMIGTDPHVLDVTIACMDADLGPAVLPFAPSQVADAGWHAAPPAAQQSVLHDAGFLSYAIFPPDRMMVGCLPPNGHSQSDRGIATAGRSQTLALRSALLVQCGRPSSLWPSNAAVSTTDTEDNTGIKADANDESIPAVHCLHLLQVFAGGDQKPCAHSGSVTGSDGEADRRNVVRNASATRRSGEDEKADKTATEAGPDGGLDSGMDKTKMEELSPLDARLRDIARSFHHLQVVGQMRHSLPSPWSQLPWHVAVVSMLIDYLA